MLSAKQAAGRGCTVRRASGPRRALVAVRVQAVATTPSKPASNAATPASSGGSSSYGPVPATQKGAPALSPEIAKDLYYDMVMGREFEEMCAQMYYRGKMFGFVHLYSGQEAVSTGVIRMLRQDDYVCSTYRDHVHAISKGVAPREVMAELFGKATGCCRGQGGSMHMFSAKHGVLGGYAFIGEGIPVGLGAAFKSKYKRDVLGDESSDSVTCSFFGDGTCNVGQFYESLNMAALYKLPHIFVVENNKWAIGMNHPRATAPTAGDNEPFIYKKGAAFGMPGVLVDGMDVLKVREVAAEAIARARRGDGPTLIEAETYRFRGHSLADPDELRSKEEKAHYAARDPIPQLKAAMLKKGWATEAEIKAIEQRVADEVDDAVRFADESPKPEKGQLLENVFADPRGFGIAPDGRYRYELPGFTSGTAAVS
jgi:pyruvate dehydrogenase E1 component alpha subunit